MQERVSVANPAIVGTQEDHDVRQTHEECLDGRSFQKIRIEPACLLLDRRFDA
jgi:hypothetical protein